jgi:hypothetical protein
MFPLNQNPALRNFLNQNPALLSQLQQNPALLNQLLQNPALLEQLQKNPGLLDQLTGSNNGQGTNSGGFPFFGGAFFPFGVNSGAWGQSGGYSLPDTTLGGSNTQGKSEDEAWAAQQKNAVRMAQMYAEMRQANQAQKRARDRHSPEALAKAAEVPHLTRDELDPVTGKIRWPAPLMSDDFAKSRDEVERLFELRSWTTHQSEATVKIRDLVHSMGDVLRQKIDDMGPEDFVAARKFLDGIEVAAVSSRS